MKLTEKQKVEIYQKRKNGRTISLLFKEWVWGADKFLDRR